jgi:hypothetical protein
MAITHVPLPIDDTSQLISVEDKVITPVFSMLEVPRTLIKLITSLNQFSGLL